MIAERRKANAIVAVLALSLNQFTSMHHET